MASDYMGYYEEGVTPPEGSKTWIAPFTQDAFDKVIKPNEEFINLFCYLLLNPTSTLSGGYYSACQAVSF